MGRYLALEWLDRMDLVNGKLICLVRARSDEEAQARLDATFDSGDPYLVRHYRELGAGRLEVLAGDKGEADLGLDRVTWQRLADTVDLIVDPAALVNHVLPYSQLFGPNAAGTAELLRLALTGKRKPYIYTSTIAVGEQIRRRRSPRTPTSGPSARPAGSTTATPTATRTASGPARCCCAKLTSSAACR